MVKCYHYRCIFTIRFSLDVPQNSEEKILADVSFLEERSYTYAWLSVAEQITKYEKITPLINTASIKVNRR